jgi:hypothetical protein
MMKGREGVVVCLFKVFLQIFKVLFQSTYSVQEREERKL